MTGRGVRIVLDVAAAAVLVCASLTVARAAEAACIPIDRTAIALSPPLDRSEEPIIGTICVGVVAAAAPRVDADIDATGGSEPVGAEARSE